VILEGRILEDHLTDLALLPLLQRPGQHLGRSLLVANDRQHLFDRQAGQGAGGRRADGFLVIP
jgi:hypothetical protein